jgi:hypothetical protein
MSDMGEKRDTADMPDETKREERRAADRQQMTREPLRDNPEVMEREKMRNNPEVMGRKEPVAVADRDRPGRVGGPGEQRSDIWPDMSDFHRRWDQLQSDFIEEPREAVKKAEQLIVEMLDHVTKSMRDRMKATQGEGKADTEHLRLTMQRYKEFIRSFGRREAV